MPRVSCSTDFLFSLSVLPSQTCFCHRFCLPTITNNVIPTCRTKPLINLNCRPSRILNLRDNCGVLQRQSLPPVAITNYSAARSLFNIRGRSSVCRNCTNGNATMRAEIRDHNIRGSSLLTSHSHLHINPLVVNIEHQRPSG